MNFTHTHDHESHFRDIWPYGGSLKNLKDLKDAGLCCGSRLRKGGVFAYVGLINNLKDLKNREALKDLKGPNGPKGPKHQSLSNNPGRYPRLKGPKTQLKLAELYTGRGVRRRGAGGRGDG